MSDAVVADINRMYSKLGVDAMELITTDHDPDNGRVLRLVKDGEWYYVYINSRPVYRHKQLHLARKAYRRRLHKPNMGSPYHPDPEEEQKRLSTPWPFPTGIDLDLNNGK